MNRVTRVSSAAFGMLLLAGLAVYQGDEGTLAVEEGSLAGTALAAPPEKRDVDCEDTARLSSRDLEFCAGKNRPVKDD